MEDIIKQIKQADEIQLNQIISVVIHRYNELHPEREAIFLSLPTDLHLREQELENIIRFIHKE